MIIDLNQLHIQVLAVSLGYGYRQKKHLHLVLSSNVLFILLYSPQSKQTNKLLMKKPTLNQQNQNVSCFSSTVVSSFSSKYKQTECCALLTTFRHKRALLRKDIFSPKVLANILMTRLSHQDKLYGITVADCRSDSSHYAAGSDGDNCHHINPVWTGMHIEGTGSLQHHVFRILVH